MLLIVSDESPEPDSQGSAWGAIAYSSVPFPTSFFSAISAEEWDDKAGKAGRLGMSTGRDGIMHQGWGSLNLFSSNFPKSRRKVWCLSSFL